MKGFDAPKDSLGDLKAEAAATLIAATSDVALIVDGEGVVRDLALGSEEISLEDCGDWLDKPWLETVTVESREKIEEMLRGALSHERPRWRQVNHPSPDGMDLPILYSAMQVGRKGPIIAIGRDLRTLATLQQRLVDAQQSMEREYARLREAETRYRLLFQIASEAVLIVEAESRKIIEANSAAADVLGKPVKQIVGVTLPNFPDRFDAEGRKGIDAQITALQAAGRADDIEVRSPNGSRAFVVSSTLFRQDNASHCLVRLSSLDGELNDSQSASMESRLIKVLESSPDALVITDPDGRILTANRAFLDLTELAADEQVRNESLDRWLGRPGVDLNVLRSTLREHGSVRLFATTMRGEYGAVAEVEISAVSVLDGDPPCHGFMIRNVGRRLSGNPGRSQQLPRSVEQLTELVGRMSLKDIVRETADVIERLCIETALKLTGNNRASAAEMLRLSRQSFYTKLRRHGLAENSSETKH